MEQNEMHITLCNGTITVTGDRNSTSSETEKIKFKKRFRISKNSVCGPQDIKARLTQVDTLRVILPPKSREDQTGYHKHKGYVPDDSWLARTRWGLSFDKRLVAKAVAVGIVDATGLAIGGYFAFRHV